jgi:arylsulfatase A-like enzyme
VQNQDLPATILSLCGVEVDEPLDGVDAWAVARGSAAPARDHIVTGWGNRVNVRDERYSAHASVIDVDPGLVVYDLEQDPEERAPLVEVPAEVRDTARARIEAVVGEMPTKFGEYPQRHAARSMRTLAQRRWGR